MSGNDGKKLAFLLLISVVAGGSVVYQIRNRRPPRPSVTTPAPPQIVREDLTKTPPAADSAVTPSGDPVAQPEATGSQTTIPPGAWGRAGRTNPFLSLEEFENLNRPPVVEVRNEAPPPPPPPTPSTLPTYSVSAIIARSDRNLAVVGTRVLQAGDRLGYEIVKEIKERSVVLEYEGHTRELSLRRPQNDIRQNIEPKGE